MDLNNLINEIIKLIELKKKFSVEFVDKNNLVESDKKIELIKETLNDIYLKFNENILDNSIQELM